MDLLRQPGSGLVSALVWPKVSGLPLVLLLLLALGLVSLLALVSALESVSPQS